MRALFLYFPIRNAVRTELSWTHYRILIRIENNKTVAKYSVLNESEQLFASKYITELPTEEELRQQLEKDRRLILEQQGKYEY